MKKNITIVLAGIITILAASRFGIKQSTGYAGYTGSPGESTCANPGCHGGGSSSAKGVTITSSPTFSNDQYVPGTLYTLSVTIGATGFSWFGFGCEILDTNTANAGTMQAQGSGVKFLNAGSRKNATHTTPKSGTDAATFVIKRKAHELEKATIYVCGNAVNHNNTTTGDLPIPAKFELLAVPPPEDTTSTVDTTTSIKKNIPEPLSQVNVFPNPASGFTTISYVLKATSTVAIQLTDIGGRQVRQFFKTAQNPGEHSEILNLYTVPRGVYFVKIVVNELPVASKLLSVN
jgi:hypothetical protein